MNTSYETYDDVRARLDQIVDAVNSDDVTLDEALALYEEAVKLGLLACDLSEEEVEEFAVSDEAEDSSLADETEPVEDGAVDGDVAQAEAGGETEAGVRAVMLNQPSTVPPDQTAEVVCVEGE